MMVKLTDEERKKRNREACKKWREANKEKIAEYGKEYRGNNKEKETKRHRKYKQENKEELAEYMKQYQQENSGIVNANNAKRRATKKNATPKWANLDVIKEIYRKCPAGSEVDHIIPLKGRTVCGLHVENNL
jgi:hypothetical protein